MISTSWLSDLTLDLSERRDEAELPAEGLRDLLSTNLGAHAREAANEELDWINARRGMLEHVSSAAGDLAAAIDALNADGYPGLRHRPVPADVFADLDAQRESITAALALFAVTASAVDATVSAERPTSAVG